MDMKQTPQDILDAFAAKDKEIAGLKTQVADGIARIHELSSKLEAAWNDASTAKSQCAEWKLKCETMGAHPEVKAAALVRAEANLKSAQAEHERQKASAANAQTEVTN